jgi:hypothetical protein
MITPTTSAGHAGTAPPGDVSERSRGRRLASLTGGWRDRLPTVRPVHALDLVVVAAAVAATLWTTQGKFLWLDVNFDLRYYHAYLGWALFHDGIHVDLHPSGVGSYLNPALDVVNYFAMSVVPARLGSTILLAIHLSSAVPVYLIARLLMPTWRRSFAAAAGVLSLGGALVTSEWGTTFGDLTSAPIVLWGVYLLLGARRESTWRLVVAGLLTGAAVGLKLTNGPYGVAGCVLALLVVPRLMPLLRYGIGLAVGFVLSAGPWMLVMWGQYRNPVFPLLNAQFKSPYAAPVTQADGRFGGRGFGEILLFPFKLVMAPAGFSSELPSSDWRWPLWAVSVVLVLVLVVLQLPGSSLPRPSVPESWRLTTPSFRRLVFLQAYLLVAFLLWCRIFGIQRYAIVIEILAVPVLIALLGLLTSRVAGMTVLTLLLAAGLGWNTVTLNWSRIPMPAGAAIPVGSVTQLQDYSAIIVGPTQPSTFVAVAVGGDRADGTRPAWLGQPYNDLDKERGLHRMPAGRTGVLVRGDASDPLAYAQQGADWFDLKVTGECTPVPGVPFGDPMLICEVDRSGGST